MCEAGARQDPGKGKTLKGRLMERCKVVKSHQLEKTSSPVTAGEKKCGLLSRGGGGLGLGYIGYWSLWRGVVGGQRRRKESLGNWVHNRGAGWKTVCFFYREDCDVYGSSYRGSGAQKELGGVTSLRCIMWENQRGPALDRRRDKGI